MVYKRYIYKKGKKHGPYYYESYRDKDGKTRSRYLPNYKPERAVTSHSVGKKKFISHPMIFVLLIAIVAIVLGVAYLNYQLQDEHTNSQRQDATFFSSLSNSVYGFFTGFVTDESSDTQTADSATTDSSSTSVDSENSGSVGVTSDGEITSVETDSESDGVLDSSGEETTDGATTEETPQDTTEETTTEQTLNEDVSGTEDENTTNLEEEQTSNETASEDNQTTIQNMNESSEEPNNTSVENVTVEENITTEEFNGSNETVEVNNESESGGVVISNETNYTLSNETNQTLNESFGNESVENATVVLNATNVTTTVSTRQFGAVLGQPVRWEKKVKVDSGGENVKGLKIDLPKDSGKVSVKKKTDIGEEELTAYVQNEKSENDLEAPSEESGGSGIDLVFDFFLGIFRGIMTGRAVDSGDGKNVSVEILDEVNDEDEIVVEYYTQAPYSVEEESGRNKKVTIVGPDEIHYENILAFSELPQEISNPNSIKLYHIVDGVRKSVNFDAYDRNENGLVDYIEWVVPHLSNQTYEIIVVTKAEHLDSNRGFISDIYNNVKELDDVWSENISDGEYVRVTFERNLTSSRDITVYPRIVEGNPKIEVYEIGETNLITEFENLTEDEYNKVYLDDLVGTQDTFDLRVVGGSVEFDHILDPSGACSGGSCVFDYNYILADIDESDNSRCQGDVGFQIKWDVTDLCDGSLSSVDSAILSVYLVQTSGSLDTDARQTYISDQTWDESSSVATINSQTEGYLTVNSFSSWISFAYANVTVTTQLSQACTNGDANFTIRLEDPDNLVSPVSCVGDKNILNFGDLGIFQPYRGFASDEYATTTNRPILYVTYTASNPAPQWVDNSTNSTVRGTAVEHRVYWTDDTALSGYVFSFDNGTGSYTNDSWVSLSGTGDWSNVTKVINSTNGTTIKWRVYANDTDNEWNVTDEFSYVANSSIPTHDAPSVTPYPTATESENLTCLNQSTNDLDGDSVSNVYNWLVDGDPILLLNLPFDTNVSVNTSDAVRDYSGLGNNATLGNSTGDMIPTWIASPGKMGGGYLFDGNSKIVVGNSTSLDSVVGKNFTVTFWFNDTGSGNQVLFVKGDFSSGFGVFLDFLNRACVFKDGACYGGSSLVSSQNSLAYYAVPCNETDCSIYFNGAFDFGFTGINETNNFDLIIGADNDTASLSSSGYFADFKIFNRTLSADEIEQLYKDENYVVQPNSSVLSSMTNLNENWTCEVTPNDATFDGLTKQNYTTISIQDDPPVVNLSSPADGLTYEGTGNVLFYCNVSDDYDIVNISLYGNWSGGWAYNDSVNVTGEPNTTYYVEFDVGGIPEGTYGWNCLAYDNNSQSSWNATNFTFTHDNCASVTQVGTSTTLTADACEHYNLTADNIVFDCDDYTIHGFNSFDYWGIQANGRDNVTIKNCRMEEYAKGILFNSTGNSTITNVVMYNNSFVNETDTTTYGIYLDEGANDNLINDTNITLLWGNSTSTADCYSGAVYGVYVSDSNNTIINNSVFDSVAGQYYGDASGLAGCQGGYVDSGTEIYFPSSDYSDNIQVLNSNFSAPGVSHIELGNVKDFSLNDSILYNKTFFTITGAETFVVAGNEFRDSTDATTISCGLIPSCTISDKSVIVNNLFDNVGGVSISNSNSNGVDIFYNTFNNIDTDYLYAGVNNMDIKHNIFANATSFGASDEGIYVKSGLSGAEIYNNTFTNMSGAGSDVMEIVSAPSNFSYNTIDGCTVGVYFNGVTATFNHSSVSSCTNDFKISATTNVDLFNVSFDKSSVDFVSDVSGSLEPFYYFRVNVTDQNLEAVDSADVNVSNLSGILILSDLTTDAAGLTPWNWVREYTQTGDATYSEGCSGSGTYISCATPHNVSAIRTGHSGNFTNSTINETKTQHIIIQTPYIQAYVPTTDIFSIAEPSNQTFGITYVNTTPVSIHWFVNDSEQTDSVNSSSFIWSGNYSQEGYYEIKVNISNEYGDDEKFWLMTVNDTLARINFDRLYPSGNLNVSKYVFFNVTFNVSCASGPDCGAVNVSVYHNDTTQNPVNLLYEDDFATQNSTFWQNMSEDAATNITWTSGYVELRSVNGLDYTGGSLFMNSSYNLSNTTSYKIEWQEWYNRSTGYGDKYGRNGMWLLNASKDWSTTGGDTYRDGFYSSPARGICYAQNVWTDVTGGDDLDFDGYAIAADDDNSGWAFYDVMPAQNDLDIIPYEEWVNYTAIINFTSGNLTFWAVNSTSGEVISNITGNLASSYLGEISPDFIVDFHLSGYSVSTYEEIMRIDNFKIYDIETGTSEQDVLLSTTEGGTPFYTNATSNPFTTILLNSTNYTTVNFWINATGNVNDTYGFVASANSTDYPSVSNMTDRFNVTIAEEAFSVAIDLSTLLSQQINWTLSSLPAVNISAPGNTLNEYYVNISVTGGTADLYVRANDDLQTIDGDVLEVGNETYQYTNDTGDWTGPNYSLTTNFSDNKIGSGLSSGEAIYLRFYLSAPSAQAAGNYNNTLYFKAVKAGVAP